MDETTALTTTNAANDPAGKPTRGSTPWIVLTTVVLLGLAATFYSAGPSRRGNTMAPSAAPSVAPSAAPLGAPLGAPGDYCTDSSDCAIPPGLDHGFCSNYDACQSGQPGSFCTQTSDCVVQNELDPPHAVCRGPSYGDKGTGANKISYRKCQR